MAKIPQQVQVPERVHTVYTTLRGKQLVAALKKRGSLRRGNGGKDVLHRNRH